MGLEPCLHFRDNLVSCRYKFAIHLATLPVVEGEFDCLESAACVDVALGSWGLLRSGIVDQESLSVTFARFGALDPASWAASEIGEDIPQLARYLFLKGAWECVVEADDPSWIQAYVERTPEGSNEPHAGIGHALRRLLASGADLGDIHEVVRGMQAVAMGEVCYLLADPSVVEGNDVVSWELFELDEDDCPARVIGGLHESVLETDPTGREMRPEV